MKILSVAMATYCGDRFLRQQLDSIAAQSYAPAELVVCDDCSTDSTKKILQEFAATARFPVRLYHNAHNLGYIENFFKAISLCKGKYISLCDQDDIWFPNKLEVAIGNLRQTDAWLHTHSAELIDAGGVTIGVHRPLRTSGFVSYRNFDPWNTFFGFTCTFKRELLSLVPLSDRPIDLIYGQRLMAHDRWITQLGLLVEQASYSDTPLVGYRQHDRNTFGSKGRNLVSKLSKIKTDYENYLAKRASISVRMRNIARDLSDRGIVENRTAAAMWTGLSDEYVRRCDVFRQQSGMVHRISRVMSNYKIDRNLRGALEDCVAIVLSG